MTAHENQEKTGDSSVYLERLRVRPRLPSVDSIVMGRKKVRGLVQVSEHSTMTGTAMVRVKWFDSQVVAPTK